MAAHLRARDLANVLAGVAAILFALELVYLAVGNAIVKSGLIQRAIASDEDFRLDYGTAYTLWPGHVHVRDLSLRVEDYNVQFEVAIAEAELDIALSQLLFKKFRVTGLEARGTRFRMRHKLIVVGDDAERVAAYPPIRGFADPPYYVGLRPPPIPDSEYDLWEVRIENVVAQVSELWLLEHRFRGEGVARGSFAVKPARWVQVEPATLELSRGRITLGEHVVAQQVRGRITCDIPDMDVQAREGSQVLKDMSSSIRLDLRGGNLDFLDAYLARLGRTRFQGNFDALLDLNVQRGVIQLGSRASVTARPLLLQERDLQLAGDVMLSLGREATQSPQRLLLAVAAPRLTVSRGNVAVPSPTLEGVTGSLELDAVDLSGELALGAGRVAIERARAPALGWFDTEETQLQGSAVMDVMLARDAAGGVSGQAHVRLSKGALASGSFRAQGNLQGSLAFARPPASDTVEASELELSLDEASLGSSGKRSKPFALTADASGLRVRPGAPLEARGPVQVHVSSAAALLPLVMSEPLQDVSRAALDLKALEARANLELVGDRLNVTALDARSGNLHLRGYLHKRAKTQGGAFLISSGPIRVGVTLKADGTTDVSPFVGADWLARPTILARAQ